MRPQCLRQLDLPRCGRTFFLYALRISPALAVGSNSRIAYQSVGIAWWQL